MPRTNFFNPRKPSLLRGTLLPLLAIGFTYHSVGFPDPHPSAWLWLCTVLPALGALDCFRSLQKQWSLLHAGILLLFYTNLMLLATILFMIYFLQHP